MEMEKLLDRCIIAIDKPCGPSSHEVTFWASQILGRKCGHSGTLDPQVSGVLLIGVGKGRKILEYLLKKDKEYVGIMKFHKDISRNEVEQVFGAFEGKISQLPPVKSAVARKWRKRSVYSLELLEIKRRTVLFKAHVEAGTYIRKLCHDIGEAVKTKASMLELRRIKAGNIGEERAITLQELSDFYWLSKEKGDERFLRKAIIPLEEALDLKRIIISEGAREKIVLGSPLAIPGVYAFDRFAKGEEIGIFDASGLVVASGKTLMDWEEAERNRKGFVVKTDKVLI